MFENRLKNSLNKLSAFKFVIDFVLKLKKALNEDETKYSTFYLNPKAEIIIHGSDIDNVFESIYNTVVTKIQQYQAVGLVWTIDSVEEQNISILEYKPLSGSSHTKLSKQLNHSRKDLINIQNTVNNKCLRWC